MPALLTLQAHHEIRGIEMSLLCLALGLYFWDLPHYCFRLCLLVQDVMPLPWGLGV